ITASYTLAALSVVRKGKGMMLQNRLPRWTKISFVPLMVALVLAFMLGSATGAAGGSASATYQYLLGAAPAERPDLPMPRGCSTVPWTGAGTLSVHPQSVRGGGRFTISDSAGTDPSSGTWTAQSLSSFVPYGCGVLLGNPRPPNFCGGEALIQVQLST